MKIFKAELKTGQYFRAENPTVIREGGFVRVETEEAVYYINEDNINYYSIVDASDDLDKMDSEDLINAIRKLNGFKNR